MAKLSLYTFFFFNDTATTEIYTLSLHDALPILPDSGAEAPVGAAVLLVGVLDKVGTFGFLRYCLPLFPDASDRKSTRLNSSHANISYAVFCLKKKHDSLVASQLQVELYLVHHQH